MNQSTTILIFVLAILLLLSAYFSATETAYSTYNKVRMKTRASQGDKRASQVLMLAENYDRLLSTILIGNNIVNITSASLATVIFTQAFGKSGVTLSTMIMTVLVLIFGEISPKSLAKESPDSFALFSAPYLQFFLTLLAPLNYFFMLWKKLLSKLFSFSDERKITEEELLVIVDEAQQEGGINESESELIKSAIEFNDLAVHDILTPRVRIIAISEDETAENIKVLFRKTGYSRLPVFHEDLDEIIGYISHKDFYNGMLGEKKSLASITKPIDFVAPNTRISAMLARFQQSSSHIAVVLDEYGGTSGIVTMEDIIEELVGEIWDEHDKVLQEYTQLDSNDYLVSGNFEIRSLFDLLNLDEPDVDASTVGGWIIEKCGRIPQSHEALIVDDFRIEIIHSDNRKIHKIHLHLIQGDVTNRTTTTIS